MINVSAEFKELMKTRTDFRQFARITIVDGTVWELDDSDFLLTGNSVNDGVDANGLPLGVVVGRSIKLSFRNINNQFEDVPFFGATIDLFVRFQLSETTEQLNMGRFTVISPETYGETIAITAVDDAYKLDKDYATGLSFPQTIGSMLRDICGTCDVLLESADFLNNDYVVDNLPEDGGTFRDMVGYIAMLAGGNARFNRSGRLEIITYEFPEIPESVNEDYDGGTFEGWNESETLDGGDFADWNQSDSVDGGRFNPWDTGASNDDLDVDAETHVLSRWLTLKPFTEDVVVTGIQTIKVVTDNEGNETQSTVLYGQDGYVLSVENPLFAGKEEAALALVGAVMVGARVRNFEGDHIGYPIAEFMDKAILVDRNGNLASTVITDVNFSFLGITTMQNTAAPPVRVASKYKNAAAQAIIAAKKLVDREKTQRELAIENLNKTLATSSGMYSTEVEQPDGSTIYYLHDKPTIGESQNVMKLTAEAIGFSTDGGETFPFGFTLDGNMVAHILATEGINADWINAGAFRITDNRGNVLFDADIDTKSVTISGNILQIISDYFTVARDGKITATGGTIGGFNIDENRLYTEDRETPDGQYVPGVSLDAQNGEVSVGVVKMKSTSPSLGSVGTDTLKFFFNESANRIGVTGDVLFSDEVTFEDAVFKSDPQFPNPLSVSSGGTGKNSITQNAVLLGNNTDPLRTIVSQAGAFYSTGLHNIPKFGILPVELGGTGASSLEGLISLLGFECGQAEITLGTSTTETVVSLANADEYAITANPNMNTGNPINWTVCAKTSTGFTIKCAPNSALSGRTVGFDWIAKKLS